ncbi:hypothetical protein NPIL_438871 [Nephila pilipes]|uniref:Uncharacterized protein n=1 Tax=Nephila pilipes TaxID=299642 RepID=A0A8X6PPP4_NEPPI|nr:hypothetical protein NPIL_438871 [Nephila pilipes]
MSILINFVVTFVGIGPERERFRNVIAVILHVKSPEVIVMSHKPLYNAMDIFSYIGGLMGCWLGISVWACTGIAEASFLTGLHFLKQYVMNSRHSSSARNQILFRRNHLSTMVI